MLTNEMIAKLPQAVRDHLVAQAAALAAAEAKAAARNTIKLKVSEKGALSIYGLGRFPVTLYRSQMERLLGMANDINAFIAANSDKLAVKE